MTGAGLPPDYFGLLTAVSMKNLCVLSYGTLTAFITAGMSNPNPDFRPQTGRGSRPIPSISTSIPGKE